MNESFKQFYDRVNEILDEWDKSREENQKLTESVDFLNKTIVPRLSKRPAIFESMASFQKASGLVHGDIAMVFIENLEEGDSYLKVYKVEKNPVQVICTLFTGQQ